MAEQLKDITLKWAHLQERVDVFQRQAATIFQAASDPWDGTLVREAYIGAEFDELMKEMMAMNTLYLPMNEVKCKQL